jgi:hypothetical protein
MSIDGLMSEYEGALFDAIAALSRAVADGACDRATLAARYREIAQDEANVGHKNGAATLELLARQTEADRFYSARPQLSIIDGGKAGDPPK